MKKYLKILAFIVALVLVAATVWIVNAFIGNPVSKMLAEKTAEKHLAEHYARTDYCIERVKYSFKEGDYLAFVKSPTSMDTEFTLYITMSGRLCYDSYEHNVLNGNNTARRVDLEYRNLTDTVLESVGFPYRLLDFVLEYPEKEDGRRPEGKIILTDIPYDEIDEDGITERIQKAVQ